MEGTMVTLTNMKKLTGVLLSSIFIVSFSYAAEDSKLQDMESERYHSLKVAQDAWNGEKDKVLSKTINYISDEEKEKFKDLFEKNRNQSQKPSYNDDYYRKFQYRSLYNSEGRLIITETH
jgi:hypothetical protein